MSNLNFSLNMLEWAANNIGLRLEEAVTKISESEKTQKKLLNGEFSVNQAENFAKITNIPFGYLFLNEPPLREKPSLPDLRQAPNFQPLSNNFYAVLEDVKFKQEWYIDFLKSIDAEPLKFVGAFKDKNVSYKIIAKDIYETLGLPISTKTRKDRDKYLSSLIEKCEKNRILIFRSGVVKNNNNRPLEVSDFRGFVISNNYAPAIFINLQDAPSARIFTLAHELAHIWLGQSAVDDLDIYGNDKVEVLCNRIAAEVLVPEDIFLDQWTIHNGNIQKLSDHFGVSILVISRVALTLNQITKDKYNEIYNIVKVREISKIKDSSGGSYYTNTLMKNTNLVSRAVINSALTGKITLREAGHILDMNPQSVISLGERIS
ncbi:ImmA/IrrE family metallo-endopeptidase [Acinetobacter baumannii]|nr:ImmA/IrrE family metallo-endopeptidase [Acinetobacter baumannii]